MKKYMGVFIIVALVAVAFVVADAAASSGDAEDKIVGIIDRILNVIADFFDRIFSSLADAIKSIFTGDDSAKK
ncbi:MAG: hypothetical protein CMF61_00370 [Magnetococcales bacterium]|nr:hypothetical protein [Magnetococcales bacterium]